MTTLTALDRDRLREQSAAIRAATTLILGDDSAADAGLSDAEVRTELTAEYGCREAAEIAVQRLVESCKLP